MIIHIYFRLFSSCITQPGLEFKFKSNRYKQIMPRPIDFKSLDSSSKYVTIHFALIFFYFGIFFFVAFSSVGYMGFKMTTRFLVAKLLYNCLCPSVRPYVRPYVRPSGLGENVIFKL